MVVVTKDYLHAQVVADSNWNQINNMLLPSGSSYRLDEFRFSTGTCVDPYRYPVLQQHEVDDDLWKCESCGKVYRVANELECKSCGTSITEKSRFVLK